ncbi:class I SAM-dependent methyltransferase [Flavobacterium aquidurense]|uniref:Methyltransferase type 11 n=1 Tax=Flavobacterium aquidurense TaxID=362413 RepID=A0A0Q0S7P7_9FLAO|nr:class I SAM-dependent methyltransferase [Flavobacterium aquidurense]KQB41583.1 Methyltransferase type 11 [Flavobacterium aquidurense]
MNHKLKTILFKSLTLLPNKVDDYCYHKIQSFFDKSTLEDRLKSVESTYSRLSKVLTGLDIDLKDKVVFEFGSGWFPSMPYFFKYKFGAKKVLTFDINEHFKKETVLKLNTLFSKRYDCEIVPSPDNKYSLPEGVEYFPNYNIVKKDFPDVDVVFSRYVLSHMNENDVDALHKKIKTVLKKGTYVIHFISPSDLRQHNDSSLSLQDFLKYSKKEWDKIHTKYDYHNRLRLPQFLEIFKKYDYEIVHLDYESLKEDTKRYELFKKVQLHEDYKKYSDEELTAGNIFVVLKV